MTDQNLKCPKCGGEIEEGYELFPSHAGYFPKKFVLNLNEKKQLYLTMGYEIKEGINIKSKRCKNCGYLESYAK